MPCQSIYDSSYPSGSPSNAALKKELDGIASVLCSILTITDQYGITEKLLTDENAKNWWIEHKRKDAEEKARMEAYEKAKQEKQKALDMFYEMQNSPKLQAMRADLNNEIDETLKRIALQDKAQIQRALEEIEQTNKRLAERNTEYKQAKNWKGD